MKFLEFIQTLFVPKYMALHKNMKIFISLLIFLVASLIMSVPSTIYLNKMKYEELEVQSGYDILKYVDDSNEFTQDELDTYNMTKFSTIKGFKLVANNTDGIQNTNYGVEDAKDYVLKAIKPIYDEEGTHVRDEITYIHLVFDFKQEENDKTYDIKENFNKIPNLEEGRLGHVLLLFDDISLSFKKDSEKYVLSNLPYYKKVEFNFENMENMGVVADKISDTYAPSLNFTYRLMGLLFVGVFSIVISMLFSFILAKTGQLRGMKEYMNVAAISSIPFVIFAFAFSFIKYVFCSLLFRWYALIFSIYYFIVVIIINRRPRIE